jgi:hypothetical protein
MEKSLGHMRYQFFETHDFLWPAKLIAAIRLPASRLQRDEEVAGGLDAGLSSLDLFIVNFEPFCGNQNL